MSSSTLSIEPEVQVICDALSIPTSIRFDIETDASEFALVAPARKARNGNIWFNANQKVPVSDPENFDAEARLGAMTVHYGELAFKPGKVHLSDAKNPTVTHALTVRGLGPKGYTLRVTATFVDGDDPRIRLNATANNLTSNARGEVVGDAAF